MTSKHQTQHSDNSGSSESLDNSAFTILHETLQRGLKQMGFKEPTPIQSSVIPAGLKGRDLLACAQTGSGKSAAFLLPILHRLLVQQDKERIEEGQVKRRTRVLILAPTRELAAQTNEHFAEIASFTNLRGAAIFGGVNIGPQEKAFRNKVDILVATPGRLLDHLSRDYAKLSDLDCLIFDEADRMLDMGFLPDIRKVMAKLPKTARQTMLFSATLPPPILKLSHELLNDPLKVNIERPPMVAGGIDHIGYAVADGLKQHLLYKILQTKSIETAIIFTRTKHRANRLAEFLTERKISCETFHSNRSQKQRIKALKDFKMGAVKLLVATDIAARGIDVEALSHVINFDVPHMPDDYIHRSGRTARANMKGIACTLVSPSEIRDFRRIENHIGKNIERMTMEDFDYSQKPKEALEIPIGVRLAKHRAKRKEERARSAAKTKNKAGGSSDSSSRSGSDRSRNNDSRRGSSNRSKSNKQEDDNNRSQEQATTWLGSRANQSAKPNSNSEKSDNGTTSRPARNKRYRGRRS